MEQLLGLWDGPAGRMLELPLGLKAWREPEGLRLDAEGYVTDPCGPGLGLEVDEAALDAAVV